MSWLIAVILTLAIARMTLIAVKDDIFIPVRELVFKYSPPEAVVTNGRWDKNPDFDETKTVTADISAAGGSTNPANIWKTDLKRAGWFGQVFSCPDCMSPYVATLTLVLWWFFPVAVTFFCAPLAASMVTSLIARRY